MGALPLPVVPDGLAKYRKGHAVFLVTDVIQQRTTDRRLVRMAYLAPAVGRHELAARRRAGWVPCLRLVGVPDPFKEVWQWHGSEV